MSAMMKRTLLLSAAPLTLAVILIVLAAATAINAQTAGPMASPVPAGNSADLPAISGEGGTNNLCAMAQRHARNTADIDRVLQDALAAATAARDAGAAAKIGQAREMLHSQQQAMVQMMQDHARQMQQCVLQIQSQLQAQNPAQRPNGMRNNGPPAR